MLGIEVRDKGLKSTKGERSRQVLRLEDYPSERNTDEILLQLCLFKTLASKCASVFIFTASHLPFVARSRRSEGRAVTLTVSAGPGTFPKPYQPPAGSLKL